VSGNRNNVSGGQQQRERDKDKRER